MHLLLAHRIELLGRSSTDVLEAVEAFRSPTVFLPVIAIEYK